MLLLVRSRPDESGCALNSQGVAVAETRRSLRTLDALRAGGRASVAGSTSRSKALSTGRGSVTADVTVAHPQQGKLVCHAAARRIRWMPASLRTYSGPICSCRSRLRIPRRAYTRRCCCGASPGRSRICRFPELG